MYSFSSWVQSNVIVGCPEFDKHSKKEMVLLEGAWVEKWTLANELPNLNFKVGRPWSKPDQSLFDDELIEDLRHIATLSIINKHYQVP